MASLAETTEQRVAAFRKRMSSDDSSGPSKRPNALALLSGGQDEPLTQSDETTKDFTELYTNSVKPLVNYMEQAALVEYNETNKDKFFEDNFLVKRFGHTATYRMRLGLDKHSQAYKLYIRRENRGGIPTVASMMLAEANEIVTYIKDTLESIKKGIEIKETLFHYGPKEIRNPKNPAFWDSDDGFLSTSITARMRFLHVKSDRYQFFLNSPIVLESRRFTDYLGPILIWCLADVEEFLFAVNQILKKVDPDEL